MDLHDTHQWLRSTAFKVETEGFIVAAEIRAFSLETFRLVFFIMGQTLGVGSVIQAPRLSTTSAQGALFLPQMSIQTQSSWTIYTLENL